MGDLLSVSHRHAFVGEAHFLGESGVRHPVLGCTRRGLFQHLVDLLERKALRLRNKEIGKGKGDAAERSPQEEDFRTKVRISRTIINEVRSNGSDDLKKQSALMVMESVSIINLCLHSSRTSLTQWKDQHPETGSVAERFRRLQPTPQAPKSRRT